MIRLALAAILVIAAMASRPAPQPAPTAMGAAGIEQDGSQPSVAAARTAAPSTSAATSPSRPSAGTGAARVGSAPDPASSGAALTLHGRATWYAAGGSIAAAGPDLRRALGPGWRGSTVEVCSGGRCVVVRLTDWCGCPRALIDLSSDAFARLAPVSRGVIRVTVSPLRIVPPQTDTEP